MRGLLGRLTNFFYFPGTFLVLKLNVICPENLLSPRQTGMVGCPAAALSQKIWTPSGSLSSGGNTGTRVFMQQSVPEPPVSFFHFCCRNRNWRWAPAHPPTHLKDNISKPSLQIIVAVKLSSGQWKINWNHILFPIVSLKGRAPESGCRLWKNKKMRGTISNSTSSCPAPDLWNKNPGVEEMESFKKILDCSD